MMYGAFYDPALLAPPSSPAPQPSLFQRMRSTRGPVSALLCHAAVPLRAL